MTIEYFVAYFLLLVLTIYVLTGRADFGAGFSEIFARGKKHQRWARSLNNRFTVQGVAGSAGPSGNEPK